MGKGGYGEQRGGGRGGRGGKVSFFYPESVISALLRSRSIYADLQ